MLDGGNTVTRVFYSNKENVAVVAFKKKIAELFSGNTNDMYVSRLASFFPLQFLYKNAQKHNALLLL